MRGEIPPLQKMANFLDITTSGKFDYTCIGDGGSSDINLTYFNTLINIINTTTNNTYLYSVARQGDSGQFTMNNGTIHYLPLGALAWEDSVEATLTLPGILKYYMTIMMK